MSKESVKQEEANQVANHIMTTFQGSSLTQFGKGHRISMDQEPKYWIPTAILPVDGVLGGGFPTGRITELFGPEATYKTSLGMHALECSLYMKGVGQLYDNEMTFDQEKSRAVVFPTFLYDQVNILEDFYEDVIKKLECIKNANIPTTIVWDSMPATIPKDVLAAQLGKRNFGNAAALHSQCIPRIIKILQESHCAFICLNQVRDNMDQDSMDPYSTPGGWAIRFYATLRIQLEKRGSVFRWVDSSTMDPDGFYVQAFVRKNKLRPPMRKVMFPVVFTNNIGGCPAMAYLNWMADLKLYKCGGGRYSFESISESCYKKDFQVFYLEHLDKFLELYKNVTQFEYQPEAKQAVIKYTEALYKPLVDRKNSIIKPEITPTSNT
jgi:recombination protein RecA